MLIESGWRTTSGDQEKDRPAWGGGGGGGEERVPMINIWWGELSGNILRFSFFCTAYFLPLIFCRGEKIDPQALQQIGGTNVCGFPLKNVEIIESNWFKYFSTHIFSLLQPPPPAFRVAQERRGGGGGGKYCGGGRTHSVQMEIISLQKSIKNIATI